MKGEESEINLNNGSFVIIALLCDSISFCDNVYEWIAMLHLWSVQRWSRINYTLSQLHCWECSSPSQGVPEKVRQILCGKLMDLKSHFWQTHFQLQILFFSAFVIKKKKIFPVLFAENEINEQKNNRGRKSFFFECFCSEQAYIISIGRPKIM